MSYIIRIIENNPDISFLIAGSGTYANRLDEISKIYKNLFYFGVLKKNNYLELLSISDSILILRKSDITNNSYLPLKMLDAIFLNKKIITTNLEIVREVSVFYPLIFITKLNTKDIINKIKEVTEYKDCPESPSLKKNDYGPLNWPHTRIKISKAIKKIFF